MKKIYNKILKNVDKVERNGFPVFVKCGGLLYTYISDMIYGDDVQYTDEYMVNDGIESFYTRKSPCTYVYDDSKGNTAFEITKEL